MKKAFSLIELVFALVAIGIIVAAVLPNTRTNPVREAAVQLVSHIRYTQHLAMVDDQYNRSDTNWYKQRWQIAFISSAQALGGPSYTIYSDRAQGSTGDANEAEIARNPANPTQIMTGGHSGANKLDISDDSFIGMRKLNLGLSYGLTSVTLSPACKKSGSKRIYFDYLGRPIKGKLGTSGGGGNATAYEDDNLIQGDCDITLTNGSESVIIRIQKETGYTSII